MDKNRSERYERAQRRIRSAFALEDGADSAIIAWPLHYIVFGTPAERVPDDLFDSPARMTEFQTAFCEAHLDVVDDDFQPYLVPYLGTGVLASAFGCVPEFDAGRDPSAGSPCIQTVADAAKMRLPDPGRDGLMPRVLEMAAYMREHGPYPVSLTDSQSPLDELILMCGHERLYIWMYDEPKMVHEMLDIVTQGFIDWVKAQKAVTGERIDECRGEQGIWLPDGCGIWMADDEAVNLPPALYEEFLAPRYSRILTEFGGGVLHFCGNGSHLGGILAKMEGLRAINSGPMGNPEDFAKLQRATEGQIPLIYQEFSPIDPDAYFRDLISRISLRGLVFAPIVTDTVATGGASGFVSVERDRTGESIRVHDALRRAIDDHLSGIRE